MFDHFPFDTTGDTSDTQGEVNAIFTELGITAWEDILKDNEDINPAYDRGARYETIEEALLDIYGRGISSFSRIRYLPDEDLYAIYIEYDE